MDITREGFTKLLKVASEVDSGNYNAFDDHVVIGYANEKLAGDVESAFAVKQASLLSYAGDEDAVILKKSYQIPDFVVDDFLKYAYDKSDDELQKAATSLNDVLILDSFSVGELNKTASEIEGIMKDDLLFRKAANYFK